MLQVIGTNHIQRIFLSLAIGVVTDKEEEVLRVEEELALDSLHM
jgi:hypothetical protein